MHSSSSNKTNKNDAGNDDNFRRRRVSQTLKPLHCLVQITRVALFGDTKHGLSPLGRMATRDSRVTAAWTKGGNRVQLVSQLIDLGGKVNTSFVIVVFVWLLFFCFFLVAVVR